MKSPSLLLSCLFVLFLAGCTSLSSPRQEAQHTPQAMPEAAGGQADRHKPAEAKEDASRLSHAHADDLWERIRAGFALQEHEHAQMQQYIQWYSSHPEYINRVFERGKRYLYYIVSQLEKEGLPLEIALMPVVESAFDPFAYSHATASGMWQFMAGTGADYGLKQNWWYDGRRDVVDSTQAAIAHLKHLHTMFDGNWLHALAAYNTGQGRLMRAIKRNKKAGRPTDFWSLKLPKETRAYVPQLLALSKIVNNPSKYQVSLPELPNTPYFVSVDVHSQLDLAQAADLADISMDELYLLNAGFNRWATDPEGPHRLNIPVSQQERFNKQLAAIPEDERISWQRYTISPGDSLIKIARKFNTSVEALQTANNLRSSRIRAGDTLLIPKASRNGDYYALSLSQRRDRALKQAGKGNGSQKIIYTVRKGDSFWRIANQHQVSVSSLARWNGMAPQETLRPGQKLVIWSKAASVQSSDRGVTRKLSYRVRKGDSLARIADKFNVSIRDITRWNSVSSNSYIYPGQSLTLFVDVTKGR